MATVSIALLRAAPFARAEQKRNIDPIKGRAAWLQFQNSKLGKYAFFGRFLQFFALGAH